MTKKEFKNLKVGDKVRIKKTRSDCPIYWSELMNEYIGKIVTIKSLSEYGNKFYIQEDCRWVFHYTAIDSVVVGAVGEKCNAKPELSTVERIKQLEAEIKTLKEENARTEQYKICKKGADEMAVLVKAYTDAGFTRDEAMSIIKTVIANAKYTIR